MVDDRRAGSAGGYDFSTVKQSQAGPGHVPPPPPFAHAGMYQGAPGVYPGMPGMYPTGPGMYPPAPGMYPMAPGMYPPMPGMYPPMYPGVTAQTPQNEPKPSKMPATGFTMAMIAILPNLGMFIAMLLLVIDIGVRMGFTSDTCCLSLVGIWVISLVSATLAVIFGSIAFWGVKTKRYAGSWMATVGFVLGIVSGSLFIATHIMFFARVAISL